MVDKIILAENEKFADTVCFVLDMKKEDLLASLNNSREREPYIALLKEEAIIKNQSNLLDIIDAFHETVSKMELYRPVKSGIEFINSVKYERLIETFHLLIGVSELTIRSHISDKTKKWDFIDKVKKLAEMEKSNKNCDDEIRNLTDFLNIESLKVNGGGAQAVLESIASVENIEGHKRLCN